MSNFPEPLAGHLQGTVTTVCHCWRLTRKDGTISGFTDHDRPLVVDGTGFEPQSGLSASEARDTLGLAVDTVDVEGALSSDSIRDEDIAVVRSLETQKTASGRTPIIVCGEVERQRKMQDLVAGAAPDKRREVVQASAKDFSRVRKLVEKHAITLQRQASREDVPAQQQPARQNKEVAEPALARSRGRRL